MIKKFGIQANITKPHALECVYWIVDVLKQFDSEIVLEECTAEKLGNQDYIGDINECDMLIVLGGDGTILWTCNQFLNPPPILGVNLGDVGFLSETDINNFEQAIRKIYKGEFSLEKRAKLTADFNGQEISALNEISILKTNSAQSISITAFAYNSKILSYKCDGIIISSPTGSTAYSLSAGGPILFPQVEAMVITPVCAHSCCARPIVLPSSAEIILTLDNASSLPAQICADGKIIVDKIEKDERIVIKSMVDFVEFIRVDEYDFFSLVTKKL